MALAEAKAQVPLLSVDAVVLRKAALITVNGLYRGQTVRFVYTNASKVVKEREVLIYFGWGTSLFVDRILIRRNIVLFGLIVFTMASL